MSSESGQVREEPCCLPGDITVTKIPSGYLIGRALEQLGKGPWWEYVRIMREYDDAVGYAQSLATHDGVRAWLHLQGDEYEWLGERTPNE
jgi:hypothetical protein